MLLRNRMKCWYRYCATLVLVVLLAFAVIGDASAATYTFANLGNDNGSGFKPSPGNSFLVSSLFAQEASPNDTAIYYNDPGLDVSGITIKADGVNLISFDLTDMDFIYYTDENVTSITITGTKTASAGGGTVTTTIYPGSGSTNGHFTLTGKGASLTNFTSLTQLQFHVVMGDQNVACLDFATITLANEVHEVINTPTVQASAVQAYKTGDTEVALNWTKGNGNNRLVFAKQGVTSGVPTLADSTTYTSNADFSAATDIGGGWKCVYSGNAEYAMISGFSATTQYRFAVFEYNGYSGAEKYLQTTPATLNQSTLGSLGTWTSGDISTLNAENFWTWTDADRDSSGNTYVAHQYSDTSGQMQVQKWNGTAWSTLTSFTPASAGYGSFSDNSSIAVTGPDQFRLAILGVHGSPTATSWGVVQAKYDGSAWSYQDVETTSTVNRTYSTPLIAVDGSGNSHILYEYLDSASSPQVQQIKLASWNGSSWGYQTFSSISNYNSNNQVNKDYLLLNDASNKQHVFYFQQITASSTALHYWTNSSGTWVDTTVFTGNTDSPRKLYGAFDSSGKLHVTFTNNAFLGKVVMYLTNKSGSWATQPLMSPGLGYDKGYTALELRINGSGDIVIPLRLTTSTTANDAFKVLLKKGTNPWYVSTLSSAAPDYEDASNSYSITGATFRDDGKVMIAYANALASRPRKLMYSLAELAGNTAPTLAANNGLTLSQTTGETTITTAKLQVTDVEQAAAALAYTVGTAPTKGTLKKSGTALVATNTFTQDDIDSNRITYTPNGTLNGADSFIFTVSDGAGGSIGSTSFAITITDNVAPTVTSVTVPPNSSYATGQNLDFTVNYSETVTISGTDSTLGLTIGSTARTATYLSKTATSITYRYTVQSGDNDSDGIAVSSLTLNGTTINDGASNAAILTLNSVGSTTLVLVDSVAPTVSSVSVPSDATYKTGANLDFTVDFSENVTVNIAGGTPYIPITLNTGGTVHAAYVSGSGSSALVFRYTIVSGNSDPDGITVGSSITANGGTIRDAAANDATLALNSVASTTLVLVDAIAPAVTSVAVPINATYIAGQTLDFTVNFSKAVTVTGIDSTLGLTIGSTARTAAYLSKTTTSITYRYTVQNGDADSDGVTVGVLTLNTTTIKDAVGNDATLTLNSVGITTGVLVDAIIPNVTSVTAPTNATYTTGQNLDFIVNWSENVTVTGTDSTLGLTIGSTARTASYFSKTATSTTYRYTVQNGDIDSDGVTVGVLSLNTTTIKDSVGNDATLTLNSIGVTTGVLVDSMIPTAASATSVTVAGFTANWGSVSGATGYYLDVATDNGFSSFVGSYSSKDVGNVVSVAVTGLAANTSYYYRVRAYGASGTSGSSGVITLLTATSAPTAAAATVITFSGFTANWNSVTGATGYYLDVATDNGFTSFATGYSNKDVSNVTSIAVTGLTANTPYYYRVRAYNSGGSSASSGTINLTTATTKVVTIAADSGAGSLRDTIAGANPGDAITFDAGLNGQTITLAAPLVINQDLTISGPGAGNLTISGGNAVQPFQITGATSLILQNLTIANGAATNGGALADNSSATTTISGCVFSGNTATTNGGAIHANGAMTISDTLFSANSTVQGGAIFNNSATLSLSNVTINNNLATSYGGGIYNSAGVAIIINATIAGNIATVRGGGIEIAGGTFTLKNGIVANNTASAGPDIYGAFTSQGYNLVKTITDAIFTAATGDITGQDPLLGSLADNGGPTKTIALLSGSPAIDTGTCTGTPAADQRGMPRPQNGTCDMGAYERGVPAALTATAGTPQSAALYATFATPLTARVVDSLGGGLDGITITYTGPASGFGIAADGTAVSNSSGIAAFTAIANGTAGGPYTVTATVNPLSAAYSLVNTMLGQAITFANPGAQNFGTSPTLSASTTALGLTVTFTSTTSVCSITSSGTLTFTTTGTCTINADQAGDGSYTAAPTVQQSFSVNAVVPGAPTIGTATAGDAQATVSFTASAFTGGASISSYTVTSIPGNITSTGTASPITITGLTNGTSYTFTVKATNPAGTGSASAASTPAVTPMGTQIITFGTAPAITVGGTGLVSATGGGSGNPIIFTSLTTDYCTVSSNTVTGVKAGICTIAANQAGTASYNVASQAAQSFTIAVPLTLTVSTLADGSVATTSILNISGTVASSSSLSAFTINGIGITADSDGSFSYPVQLIAGDNTLTTIATDTVGTTVSDIRTITLNSTAPVLTVTSPSDNKIVSQSYVTVTGTIGDQSATVTWSVNGSTPQAASQTGLTYSFTANLTAGINTIQIMATSATGSKSYVKRTISYQPVFSLAVTDPATDIRTPLGNYTLTGSVADNSTPVAITISMDGQTYSPTVTNGVFQQQLPLSSEKIYQIRVTGTDQNSNSLTVHRNIIHTTAALSYTIADALLALQVAVGAATSTTSQIQKLDVAPMVNGVSVGDGKIDIEDVVVILHMAVGLIQ